MENNEDFMNDDPWNVTGKTSDKTDSNETGVKAENGLYFSPEDLGKISMALGILAFFFYKGLFSILGLVLGLVSYSKSKNSNATIGIVCSIVNLAIIVLGILGIICFVAAILPECKEILNKIQETVLGSSWL